MLLGVVLVGQIGCGKKASFRIIQPGIPAPQDEISLESEWAYVSDDEPGLERILLAFPLPGARAGDRQFFIYLRTPGKQSKPFYIGDPLPDGGTVSGFLIQATGKFAGKTVFTKGKIQLRGVAFSGGLRRQGMVVLYGKDDTLVTGEFTAIVDPLEVRDFEDDKAGDVRALKPSTDLPGPGQPGLGPTDLGARP